MEHLGAARAWSVPTRHSSTTQTSGFNFDTSEAYRFGCYPNLPDVPIVHVTIGGVTTDYYDTSQVINTRGTHGAVCAYTGQWFEEGHEWVEVS